MSGDATDRVPNAWIRDLCGVMKGVDERIDEGGGGIAGAFGVSGENDYGRKVIDFCAETGLCDGNTYFIHKSLQNCTRVARGQD